MAPDNSDSLQPINHTRFDTPKLNNISFAFVKEVLITCDTNNTASVKVIESNGGVLQDEIQNEGREVLMRRYRVGL